MVDVAGKEVTERIARASGRIVMLPATLALIRAGDARKRATCSASRASPPSRPPNALATSFRSATRCR